MGIVVPCMKKEGITIVISLKCYSLLQVSDFMLRRCFRRVQTVLQTKSSTLRQRCSEWCDRPIPPHEYSSEMASRNITKSSELPGSQSIRTFTECDGTNPQVPKDTLNNVLEDILSMCLAGLAWLLILWLICFWKHFGIILGSIEPNIGWKVTEKPLNGSWNEPVSSTRGLTACCRVRVLAFFMVWSSHIINNEGNTYHEIKKQGEKKPLIVVEESEKKTQKHTN